MSGVAAVIALLEEGRAREHAQTRFYRALSGAADEVGDGPAGERLNGLLADEQHHLSRLTARILELGGRPGDAPARDAAPSLDGWEEVARRRESDEVRWYEEALRSESLDPATLELFEEIVESERRHRAELGGKWMSA